MAQSPTQDQTPGPGQPPLRRARRIAALDIGKTHARLLLLDAASGELLWQERCANAGRAGPLCLELDVVALERWLLDALRRAPERGQIDVIVPVAHGAAAVLLDAGGAVLAAPDYEDPRIEALTPDYARERDPFAESLSPLLPMGLNLARQWYFIEQSSPELAQGVHTALTYPQYWAWRLCGVPASEVTSLGCHTDLWLPRTGRHSPLAERRGYARWLPPLHKAWDGLGRLRPELAAQLGLPEGCQILCGIHDSNASYLCHRSGDTIARDFNLVSSGTWTVIFSQGADLARLHEADDALANVDAWGRAVATTRFMGGREYAEIAGEAALTARPDWQAAQKLITQRTLALPSFAASGGPYAGRRGSIVGPPPASADERASLATLYLALMSARQLGALAARGPVVVDGPLARNPLYPALLAALTGLPVSTATTDAGAARAALLLTGQTAAAELPRAAPEAPLPLLPALRDYAQCWRAAVETATA